MWGKDCCVICVWRFYVYVRHEMFIMSTYCGKLSIGPLGSLHICQFSSSMLSSRLWTNNTDFFFCSLIFNPWETFFLPPQIKEGWVRRRINYPGQPFPLSSLSDTPDKSGPYQMPKGPSASQAIFLRFTLLLPSTAHFLFLSYYPFTPFHMILSI